MSLLRNDQDWLNAGYVYVELLHDVEYGQLYQYARGDQLWITKEDAKECLF